MLPVDRRSMKHSGVQMLGWWRKYPKQMPEAQGSAGSGSWWLRHPKQMAEAQGCAAAGSCCVSRHNEPLVKAQNLQAQAAAGLQPEVATGAAHAWR